MATGDQAAAAGLPVVPSSKDFRLGYDDINALADAVASYMTTGTVPWSRVSNKPKVSGMPGITVSDNGPSGGTDGDIWLEY